MRSTASWASKSSIVGNGRRDGGPDGRTGDAIEKIASGRNTLLHMSAYA